MKKYILMFLLIIITAKVYAEDYSPMMGIGICADIEKSQKRNIGKGVGITGNLLFFNLSIDFKKYNTNKDYSQNTISVYSGLGVGNIIMIQVGGNNDGISGRIHGMLSLTSLVYPSRNTNGIIRDVLLEYAVGRDRAGYFSLIGFGLVL